ncbi:MAG TPA: helix-turn-helix transcriptional regulator [Candidatus Limnocylindria bacterium]|nr:helix-turn-helix transcriptional regulator [Candidatus Limnocylindria bacterium]
MGGTARTDAMTLTTPRSFNSWLRGQLKEKKMSQRQLALQSGVDHSTISRLIKGDRMPSLGTATALARGLREIHDEADGPAYFAILAARQVLPTARVEYALRGDELLTEADVRELMQAYLSTRGRRSRDGNGGTVNGGNQGGGPTPRGNGYGSAASAGSSASRWSAGSTPRR